MRKTIALLAVTFLVFSSVGLAVAQDNGITWNPDGEVENKTADEQFNQTYLNPSGETDYIRGLEMDKNGVGYWLEYNAETQTDEYSVEGHARDFVAGEPRENNPQPMTTLDSEALVYELGFAVIPNYDSSAVEYTYNGSNFYSFPVDVNGFGLVNDGSSTTEIYSSEFQDSTFRTFTDDSTHQQINWMDQITHNGTEKIIYGVNTDTTPETQTHMINTRTGEQTPLDADYSYGGGYVQATKLNENYVAYARPPNDDEAFDNYGYLSVANLSGGSFSDGTASYAEMNILASNEDYITVVPQEGDGFNDSVLVYNKTDYANYIMETPDTYDYSTDSEFINGAEAEIPYPENVSMFDRGFQIEDKWFLYNAPNSTFHVYDGMEDLQAVVDVPIDDYRFGVNPHRTFEPFINENNNVSFGTFRTAATVKTFDSNVQLETQPGGCMAYLQPSDLTELSNAPSVCWVPMFTGIWILVTPFQWILLGVLIAMPVAKVTNSDIATMATIDGVLLIGMLVGTLSPGFVAIGILTTVLLAAYGRSGANITINGGGNGGL